MNYYCHSNNHQNNKKVRWLQNYTEKNVGVHVDSDGPVSTLKKSGFGSKYRVREKN